MNEYRFNCDVLVVGGGIAAFFAAIKARENGAEVILVDKGYAGKSGQSPYATVFTVYNPEWGHDLNAIMARLNKVSEYINNRYWAEKNLIDSYARFRDLISWGVPFKLDADGKPIGLPQITDILHSVTMSFDEKTVNDIGSAVRKQAIKFGVKIIDRVMVAELLKQNGRVVGAIGLPAESMNQYIFIAKSTILCVGAASFKPAGYPPLAQLTGDGEGMAYRAGADIVGKEFVDVHCWANDTPSMLGKRRMTKGIGRIQEDLKDIIGREYIPAPPRALNARITGITNSLGKQIPQRSPDASSYAFTYPTLELEAHAGHAPMYFEGKEIFGGATLGMSLRKADGIWPANERCATNLPGLFAAGDSLGTMQDGAAYAMIGSAYCGSAVTGAIAGTSAAEDALSMDIPQVSEDEILRAKEFLYAPTSRKGGFGPRWVTQLIQNTMMPYFVSFIKKEDRLEAALNTIMFIQEHLIPMMYAKDPHELRLAHETRNMALNAEMRLRSALFRKESRGNHYREDYPVRDDKNWLAWTKISNSGNKMTCTKIPVPEEWRPDSSMIYAPGYPYHCSSDPD